MFGFPQNLHVEGLIPSVMAFGRCLGLDKVTRIGPHDGTGVLAVKWLSLIRLCDPMDCSTSGSSVLHCLLEFFQIHVH